MKQKKFLIKMIVLLTIATMILTSFYSIGAIYNQLNTSNLKNKIAEANIQFTGNVTKDFQGHLIYYNYNSSAWASSNNISDFYAAFNSTYLFLGFKEIISDNGLLIMISNNTDSNYGTYNFSTLNTWTRSIVSTKPVNVFSAVWFGASDNGNPSGNATFIINSLLSTSNTSSNAVQIKSIWDLNATLDSTEIAIPLSYLFGNNTGTWSINIAALVIGGSSSWVGTGIPFPQKGPYSTGNTYFVVNNTIQLSGIIYSPITTHQLYGNITFTGNVTKDFQGHLIYYNYNSSKWGNNNNISKFYFAYNKTDIFIGIQEDISGNGLLVAISNNTNSGLGTYNFTNLNVWSRNITFKDYVNYFSAVWFGGSNNLNPSGNNTYEITSKVSLSNSSPTAMPIKSTWFFNASLNTTEISIPMSEILTQNITSLNLSISAFVIGGSSSWVGTGIPFPQKGPYSTGNTHFVVNNTVNLTLTGLVYKVPVKVPYNPINLIIIYNDHQPMYTTTGSSNYLLPWTEAHATAEYIEQALIAHIFDVNITYELSGSLLYQLENISTDPNYNNTYIENAYLPYSEVANNSTLYDQITLDYFSIPSYVFNINEPASILYNHLHELWLSGVKLNETNYEDAKVLWFLYDISTPLIEGQLGNQWKNSTIWSLHNQTSFNQNALNIILNYSKWLTGQVIYAFKNDSLELGKGHIELFTSPMYHPLVPLLLANNLTGPQGTIYKNIYYSDLLAQLNISLGQFHSIFGFWPTGIYSPEAAFCYNMVQPYEQEGGIWTASAEYTLQQSGVNALAFGNQGSNITTMLNLYTPYRVLGSNNSSIYVFFRDGYLSNAWGFNYGSMSTSAAVSAFINYLKGIYNAIPANDHNRTAVTVLLDGENWMFMSPFALDGVPFLEQLYAALEGNSTYIRTVTPTQYLECVSSHNISLPVISHIATGSWNRGSGSPAPYQNNTSLEQWSGYTVQDFYWEALNYVRNEVMNYQKSHNLVQYLNYTEFEKVLNLNNQEDNLTRAWNGIYQAEGSDWFFTMAPWDIGGSNTAAFDYIFKHDLIYSLNQLDIPVPQFLLNNSWIPVSPVYPGNPNASISPELNGYQAESIQTNIGTGYSISNYNTWAGASIYSSQMASLLGNISIAYDPSNLYIQIQPTFNPIELLSYRNLTLTIYISSSIPNLPSSIQNDIPFALYSTVYGNLPIGFPASYVAEFNPYTFQPGSTSGQYSLYMATGLNTIQFLPNDQNTPLVLGNSIQFAIPFNYLGLYPGQEFKVGIFLFNLTNNYSGYISPILVKLPQSLAKYYPISTIHNTIPANGPGNYTYPDQPSQIPPGSLDMKWINVSMNSNFIMWNFTFGQLWNIWNGPYGFSNQIVSVYISQPGMQGLTYLGSGPNANLSMPWQTMIYISGWSIYVQTYKGQEYTTGITSSVNYTTKTISVSVPLSYIGYNVESYKYTIISGSYDGYGINGWRIVYQTNTTNSGWQGGGGDPPWSSNIYCYIAPATVGEGNLTQQEALQYSPHHIPTLTPISLPIISNSTKMQIKFNYTMYSSENVFYLNNEYFVFFISNLTGQNNLYYSISTNGKSWNGFYKVPDTSGITMLSGLIKNNSIFIALGNSSFVTLYETQIAGNNVNLKQIVSISLIASCISLTNGNGNTINMIVTEGTGPMNYIDYEINVKNVNPVNVTHYIIGTGNSTAQGVFYNNTLYVFYYNNSVMSFYSVNAGKITAGNIIGNFLGITGTFSVSGNNYGNIWFFYTEKSSNTYTLKVSNLTLNGSYSISQEKTVLSSSNKIYYCSLNDYQNGFNNSLSLTWTEKGSNTIDLWIIGNTISFVQYSVITPPTHPIKTVPFMSGYFGAIISALVIIVIVVIIALIMASRKSKRKDQKKDQKENNTK